MFFFGGEEKEREKWFDSVEWDIVKCCIGGEEEERENDSIRWKKEWAGANSGGWWQLASGYGKSQLRLSSWAFASYSANMRCQCTRRNIVSCLVKETSVSALLGIQLSHSWSLMPPTQSNSHQDKTWVNVVPIRLFTVSTRHDFVGPSCWTFTSSLLIVWLSYVGGHQIESLLAPLFVGFVLA